ncbi:DnaJ C-terminal domain-containing protein [Caulobacter sp. S45]|uniref:DnaJ C-terminal domain-containing protein n=1 Tax=Caulobacter sp. S45 TaxID=1641861 RepID=UPI001576CFED|nr:J domain-containing protein [Caulobacter sp. S45]
MAQDPYTELGVARTASPEDVRKAFHKLAKTHHPDRNPDNKSAEERFKRISAAFDIVGDPEKRAKYDRGEIDADGREAPPQGYRPGPGGGGATAGFEGVDLDDILGGMFSNRGRTGGRGFAMRGSDVQARMEVDLEETITGATRRITFGDGRMLDVTIPKGATDGQVLRLRGQGYPGRGGGPPGDALVELAVRPHPLFRLEGADLHMDLPVSIPDAVLGAKVEAPTPDGPVQLTVPRHANAGSQLRLKGRGAFDPVTGRRGNLIAHMVLTLPDQADAELERFAEAWRKDRPYAATRR